MEFFIGYKIDEEEKNKYSNVYMYDLKCSPEIVQKYMFGGSDACSLAKVLINGYI